MVVPADVNVDWQAPPSHTALHASPENRFLCLLISFPLLCQCRCAALRPHRLPRWMRSWWRPVFSSRTNSLKAPSMCGGCLTTEVGADSRTTPVKMAAKHNNRAEGSRCSYFLCVVEMLVMFVLVSYRSYPAAPVHPHYQEEVERLYLEDLHRRTAWTQRAG